MPFDAYSQCPCGTGKKIKFCCPDLLPELQKINRMIEGEQHLGCLRHIEQLQKEHPERACLMAVKGLLLRMTGKLEPAVENANAFVRRHPENTTALSELAMVTAAAGNGPEALAVLQRAMALSDGGIQACVYDAMGIVAETLLAEGNWLAARALLQLQMAISENDERPVEMLFSLNRSPRIPLLFKDDPVLTRCKDDVPWKARLDEALQPVEKGVWQGAADRISKLAEEVTDSPIVWRDLATMRGWLADDPGCIEALRKYAALDVPLEDAVEATTLAMLLDDEPLQDPLDVFMLRWPIEDIETLQAALTMDKRTLQIPIDPAATGDEDNPPPKGAFILLDRPMPEGADGLELKDAAAFVGQAMVFGKRTDREARLEVVGITAWDLDVAKTAIGEIAGSSIGGEPEQEVLTTVSASEELLQSKIRPPADSTPQQLQAMAITHRRDALLKQWPELNLGVFDGKSARQIADQPPPQIPLLAAIMVLESWCGSMPGTFDFNELRTELGLPTLGPIDPGQQPVGRVPLVRLRRIEIEKLSDDDLLYGYRRAVAYGVNGALRKFAQAVVDRPALAGKDELLRAYETLARTEEDTEQALGHLDRGRAAAESQGLSPAPWLLLELQFRFARGEASEVSRLVNLLQTRHMEEPGVAEALMRFMVQIGAIRPDGTPNAPQQAAATGPEPPDEAGKIWTPGSDTGGGGGKIWTPD